MTQISQDVVSLDYRIEQRPSWIPLPEFWLSLESLCSFWNWRKHVLHPSINLGNMIISLIITSSSWGFLKYGEFYLLFKVWRVLYLPTQNRYRVFIYVYFPLYLKANWWLVTSHSRTVQQLLLWRLTAKSPLLQAKSLRLPPFDPLIYLNSLVIPPPAPVTHTWVKNKKGVSE